MIRPKPSPSTAGPTAMAVFVTVAVMLGAWVALRGTPLPAFASGRDVIRQLDPLLFERYAAPPPPEDTRQPEDEPNMTERPEEPAEVRSFDQDVGAAMAELERMFAAEPAVVPAAERGGEAAVPGAPGIDEELTETRFEELFGAGDALVVEGAAARRGARGSPGGVGLGITERSAADSGAGIDTARPATAETLPPGFEAITETRRQATSAGGEVEIGEYEGESFDASAADLLGSWMRANEAPLPVGVRAHMNFEPSFLTASVPFTSEGRSWELFLMFNESLRELHIVLVEDDRSIYLIDRGFQEESRSLREGTVRRLDGEIVAIDSRTASASSDRAREFYNVFLSWWESAKGDVGGA